MAGKFIRLFISILGFILFVLLAVSLYKKQKLNIMSYPEYENIVTESGIMSRHQHDKKGSDVFFIKLNGLNKRVGVYRVFKNYDDLLENIKIGDRIKIRYIHNNDERENINIDVVQIEKNGDIILNGSEYKTKYRIMFAISILICLYSLLAIISIIRYGQFDNVIPPIF